jgi:hypothetical protein
MAPRKTDHVSEPCVFKNLLKYAIFEKWNQQNNRLLLATFRDYFIRNMRERQPGWLKSHFGNDLLCNHEVDAKSILLLMLALLSNSGMAALGSFHHAWDDEDFFCCNSIEEILIEYIQGKAEENNVEATEEEVIMDLHEAFLDPKSLFQKLREHPELRELKELWFSTNSKKKGKQLKPTEIRARNLFVLQSTYSTNAGVCTPGVRTPGVCTA